MPPFNPGTMVDAVTGTIKLATLNRKDWGTPAWLFDTLNDEFGFAVDVCANSDNALCPEYYDIDRDALGMVWRGCVFMNPPYGRELGAWMRKAALSADVSGATVVCLVPARTDVTWWHRYAMRGEIRFVRGRLRFVGAKHNAPFPSVVVVLGPRADPGLGPPITRRRDADDAQRAFFARSSSSRKRKCSISDNSMRSGGRSPRTACANPADG